MPGPKTHEIFYRQLKTLLPEEMLADLPIMTHIAYMDRVMIYLYIRIGGNFGN